MSDEIFTVSVDMPEAKELIESLGLQDSGPVQEWFTSEMARLSDDYVPKGSAGSFTFGVDGTPNVYISATKDSIVYRLPYARVHWHGKLMVDPVTGKGAFFNEEYGFWSRPNVKKVLSDQDMQYQGAPRRGPRWVERCWIDNKDKILKSIEAKIGAMKNDGN